MSNKEDMRVERMRNNAQAILRAQLTAKFYRVPFNELYEVISQEGEKAAGKHFQNWAEAMPSSWVKTELREAGKKLEKDLPVSKAMKGLKMGEMDNTNILESIEALPGFEWKGREAKTYMANVNEREYLAWREKAKEEYPNYDNDYLDDGLIPQWFIPGDAKIDKQFMMALGDEAKAIFESLGLPAEIQKQVIAQAQDKVAMNPGMHPTQALQAVAQEVMQQVSKDSQDPHVDGNMKSPEGREKLIKGALNKPKEPLMPSDGKQLAPLGGHLQLNHGGLAGLFRRDDEDDIIGMQKVLPTDYSNMNPVSPVEIAAFGAPDRMMADNGGGFFTNIIDGITSFGNRNVTEEEMLAAGQGAQIPYGWNVEEGRPYTREEGIRAGTVDVGPMNRIHGATSQGTQQNLQIPMVPQVSTAQMRGMSMGQLAELARSGNQEAAAVYDQRANQELLEVGAVGDEGGLGAASTKLTDDNKARQQMTKGMSNQQKAVANQTMNQFKSGAISQDAAYSNLVDNGISPLRARAMLDMGHSQMGQSEADRAATRKGIAGGAAGRTGASTAADDKAQVATTVIGTRVSDGTEVVEYRDGTTAIRYPSGAIKPMTDEQKQLLQAEISNPGGGQFAINDDVLMKRYVDNRVAEGVTVDEAMNEYISNKESKTVLPSKDKTQIDEDIKNSTPGQGGQGQANTENQNVNNAITNAEGHANNANQLMTNIEREIDKLKDMKDSSWKRSIVSGLMMYGLTRLTGGNFQQSLQAANYGLKYGAGDTSFIDNQLETYSSVLGDVKKAQLKDSLGIATGDGYAPSNLEKQIKFLTNYYETGGFGEVGTPEAMEAFNSAKNNILNATQASVDATTGKEDAKSSQKQADADMAKYYAGTEALSRYDQLSQLLAGYDSGVIYDNQFMQTVRGVLQQAGIDTTIDNAEQARGQIAALLVSERQKLSGQGQVSDNETQMLADTLPSLTNTPLGNMLIVESNKLYIQRNRELVEYYNDLKIGAAGDEAALERLGMTKAAAKKKLKLGYQTISVEYIRKHRKDWDKQTRDLVTRVKNWNKPTFSENWKTAVKNGGGNWVEVPTANGTPSYWRYVDGAWERRAF